MHRYGYISWATYILIKLGCPSRHVADAGLIIHYYYWDGEQYYGEKNR